MRNNQYSSSIYGVLEKDESAKSPSSLNESEDYSMVLFGLNSKQSDR